MLDRDEMWTAVSERDAEYDGVFVYAVRTTGVYCPPSCKTRLPKRENVDFFPGTLEAEAAGYRACLKCRCGGRAVEGDTVSKVAQAARHIESQEEGPADLKQLANLVGLSPGHLQRVFKRYFGVSPQVYSDRVRMDRFRTLVREEGEDVLSAGYGAGFGSPSRLYEKAGPHLGMTPAGYRAGGDGLELSYLVVETAVGRVMVAGTARGLARVAVLGEEDPAPEQLLHEEFPAAEIKPAEQNVVDWAMAVMAWLAGEDGWPRLPVDVRGTAFQMKVWDALRRIPEGARVTYEGVAELIGNPKAVRAVASACARNPVALVVPCHRVVPKKGGIGAYRWGSDVKAKLLRHEAD